MRCSKCGTESLPAKRFCAECGSPLGIRCPGCGAENTVNSKFCADCGTPIANAQATTAQSPRTGSTASETRITPEQTDAPLAPEAERKTVTALFADIKDSTELMERGARDYRPRAQPHDRGGPSLRRLR